MVIEGFLRRVFRNWPAKVMSFAAAVLLLVFHDVTQLEERFISVPLEVRASLDLVPASSYPRQARVRLRGEADQVFSILEEDIVVFIDLSAYDEEGDYRVPVTAERHGSAEGGDTLELDVEPEVIEMTLEGKLLKSVEVVPGTSGFPPSGYELTQILMTPSSVEIEGPRSKVEGLTQVRTEDIDISGKRESFTERLRLVRPDPLVSLPGGDIVEVRGIVEEAVVLTTFEPVTVLVTGLDPQFRLAQSLPDGAIRVQARQLQVEQTEPEDVQLIIDAGSIREPGNIRLPVRPVVPEGFVILRYEPTSLLLIVEPAE